MLHETIKSKINTSKRMSTTSLNLSNADLNDDNIGELLQYFQDIRYVPSKLNLDQNNLGDLGFEKLISFAGIEEINLDRNNVTNKGLTLLKDKKSAFLKKINLSRNALDSSDGSIIELIRSICEHVYIEISLGNNISIQDKEKIKAIQIRYKDQSTHTANSVFFSDFQSATSQALPIDSVKEETVNSSEIGDFISIILELSTISPEILYNVYRNNPQAKSLICKTTQELQELGEIKRQVERNITSSKPEPTYS